MYFNAGNKRKPGPRIPSQPWGCFSVTFRSPGYWLPAEISACAGIAPVSLILSNRAVKLSLPAFSQKADSDFRPYLLQNSEIEKQVSGEL